MSRIPYYIYFIANAFYRFKVPLLPVLITYINRLLWGAYIPASSRIGKGSKFGYGGSGVVIHARAILGKNCVINPGVIIGGRSKRYAVPVIGNNVHIGGGAKVLGDVTIGNDVVIGANSVVIEDIPSGCIAVGIPAKIIKRGIKVEDYVQNTTVNRTVYKQKDLTKTGGIIVLFEDLLHQFDKHGFEYCVIDSNKENYNNKIIALFSIWYKLLTKTRQYPHVSLHGTANDYIFIAPVAVFIAKLLGKSVSLRKFAGSFHEIYEREGQLKVGKNIKTIIDFLKE